MAEIKRYKCVVSYDGTNYYGWQSQTNSIQSTIEKAISKLTNQDIKIYGSGRTDRGVHAYGQVFHFDTDKQFKDLKKAINSQLPEDIFVKEVDIVDNDFNARFDVKEKQYDYLINNGQYDPLMKNYACFIENKLDVEKMKEASLLFIGTKDFTSFNATKKEEIENQVRTINKIVISHQGDHIRLSYYGDGFLRYMVRMITATLIQIGLGKISKEEIVRMFKENNKTACPYNCDSCGLYLIKVMY